MMVTMPQHDMSQQRSLQFTVTMPEQTPHAQIELLCRQCAFSAESLIMEKPGKKLLRGGATKRNHPEAAVAVAGALAAGLVGLKLIGALCARVGGRQVSAGRSATPTVPARCLTTGAAAPGPLPVSSLPTGKTRALGLLAPHEHRASGGCAWRRRSGSGVKAGAAGSLWTAPRRWRRRPRPSPPAAAAAARRAWSTSTPTAAAAPPPRLHTSLRLGSAPGLPTGSRMATSAASSASRRWRPSSGEVSQ